uniref:Uncharacterized protein n=1 Tax=Magallana gigas TaxID=29159 RepID=K1QPY7_MAGGI
MKAVSVLLALFAVADLSNFFVRQWYNNPYSAMAGRSNLSPYGPRPGYGGFGGSSYGFSSGQSSSMEFD